LSKSCSQKWGKVAQKLPKIEKVAQKLPKIEKVAPKIQNVAIFVATLLLINNTK
jgi:hypothetical protein